MLLNDKQVFVGPFLRKQKSENATEKNKFNNVYVKKFSEHDLKKTFGDLGPITSVVVMKDSDGKSKCFGFVNFENAIAAARSVEALNGKKFDDKEWYLGKAQKKSEREVELKVKFEQSLKETQDKFQGANLDDTMTMKNVECCSLHMAPLCHARLCEIVMELVEDLDLLHSQLLRKHLKPLSLLKCVPLAMPLADAPRMTMYTLNPALGPQIFYGQVPPTVLPPKMCQVEMLPRGPMYRYPPGRSLPEIPVGGGMMSMPPYDLNNVMHMRGDTGISQNVPISALASALANASPEQQRTMLGENLYPLVEQLEQKAAAKVTGMLLEMDQTEVLHLL